MPRSASNDEGQVRGGAGIVAQGLHSCGGKSVPVGARVGRSGWVGLYGRPRSSFPLKDVDLQGQIGDNMSFLEGTSNRAIRLAYGPGAFQFGDLRLPAGPGPHPTVVLIHGGYWRARCGLKLFTRLGKKLSAPGDGAWDDQERRVGESRGGVSRAVPGLAPAAHYPPYT